MTQAAHPIRDISDRTETDILDEAAITVTLGEREYGIEPKRGRKYTRRMREELGKFLTDLDSVGGLIGKFMDEQSHEVNTLAESEWEALVHLLQKLIGPQFDDMLDLVYEFEPSIAEDREYLEENADDFQFLKALWAIAQVTLGPLASALGLSTDSLMAMGQQAMAQSATDQQES